MYTTGLSVTDQHSLLAWLFERGGTPGQRTSLQLMYLGGLVWT